MLPKLACLCITYARPKLLRQALKCYLEQDYPKDRCELIILDDAGQYVSQSHRDPKEWHLISVPHRFTTMGEKRNASAALSSPDVDAFVIWDDDDIYLPWTLRAHAAALEHAPWSVPSAVLLERRNPRMLDLEPTQGRRFHPAWAFTREVFANVRGYPFVQRGQDTAIRQLFWKHKIRTADPLAYGYDPYFIYRWSSSGSWHISALDRETGYQRLAVKAPKGPPLEKLEPFWPRDYRKAKAGHVTPVIAAAPVRDKSL